MKIEAVTTGLEAGGRALAQADIAKANYKNLARQQRLAARAVPVTPNQPQTPRDIDAEIDDLIRVLRKMNSKQVPVYVKYIRDRLDQTFGPAAAVPAPTKPAVTKPVAAAVTKPVAAAPAAPTAGQEMEMPGTNQKFKFSPTWIDSQGTPASQSVANVLNQLASGVSQADIAMSDLKAARRSMGLQEQKKAIKTGKK